MVVLRITRSLQAIDMNVRFDLEVLHEAFKAVAVL